MNIEKKRIVVSTIEKGIIGHITLDKLAIPETVKVTLLGEPIIPESFDYYGHPYFTEEQAMISIFKEEELNRQNGEYICLKAEIVYEERIFDVPRCTFDSVDGIKNSLLSLSDLIEMLHNRRRFLKSHENDVLNEFIIFGRFLLDREGRVWSAEKTAKGNLKTNGDVEELETYKKNNSEDFWFTSSGDYYYIPTAGSVCPCCGKAFTIDDVRNNTCKYFGGKFYHDSCWRNYKKLQEISSFTHGLIDLLYKKTDYQLELIPNGYSNKDCYSHIPWFLFHTIDGDIITGWEDRVISIEWQENYKPFDINELFDSEKVFKLEENGKRCIHAGNMDKAYKYLKKVLDTVNPGYSKW